MIRKQLYPLLLFCFIANFVFAKQEKVIPKALIDSYIDSCKNNLQKKDFKKALIWAYKSYAKSVLCNYNKGYQILYYTKGEYHFSLNEYEKSTYFFLKALSYPTNDPNVFSSSYSALSNLYLILGDYKKAMDYGMLELKFGEKLKIKEYVYSAYNSISNVYAGLEQTDKALEYLDKIINDKSVHNYKMFYTTSLYNAAIILADKKKNELSNKYILLALNLIKDDSSGNYFKSLSIVSENYIALKNYPLALKYISLMENHPFSKTTFGKSMLFMSRAYYAKQKKRYNEAITWFKKAVIIAQQLKIANLEIICYDKLYECYVKMNQYKNALYYYKKSAEIIEKINSEESNNYATELDKKYETERKSNQILQQKRALSEKDLQISLATQQRQKIFFISTLIIILLLTALLIVFFTYRSRQQTKLQQLKVKQQKETFAAVISGQDQERSRIASDLHDSVNQMIAAAKMKVSLAEDVTNKENVNKAIEESIVILDALTNEVRTIAHNMMPLSLEKYGLVDAIKKLASDIASQRHILSLSVNITEALPTLNTTAQIHIYRIIQELVNNTIKHAGAKNADITLSITENSILEIIYTDNGKGLVYLKEKQNVGIGLRNIETRTAILNGTLNVDYTNHLGAYFNMKFDIKNLI